MKINNTVWSSNRVFITLLNFIFCTNFITCGPSARPALRDAPASRGFARSACPAGPRRRTEMLAKTVQHRQISRASARRCATRSHRFGTLQRLRSEWLRLVAAARLCATARVDRSVREVAVHALLLGLARHARASQAGRAYVRGDSIPAIAPLRLRVASIR